MLGLSDRETVLQIQENMFLQYFLGYSSFTNEAPFVASLFVEIRERLSLDILSAISDIVIAHSFEKLTVTTVEDTIKNKVDHNANQLENQDTVKDTANNTVIIDAPSVVQKTEPTPVILNKGKLLMDATVAPQNITYPTDLKLLNTARKNRKS